MSFGVEIGNKSQTITIGGQTIEATKPVWDQKTSKWRMAYVLTIEQYDLLTTEQKADTNNLYIREDDIEQLLALTLQAAIDYFNTNRKNLAVSNQDIYANREIKLYNSLLKIINGNATTTFKDGAVNFDSRIELSQKNEVNKPQYLLGLNQFEQTNQITSALVSKLRLSEFYEDLKMFSLKKRDDYIKLRKNGVSSLRFGNYYFTSFKWPVDDQFHYRTKRRLYDTNNEEAIIASKASYNLNLQNNKRPGWKLFITSDGNLGFAYKDDGLTLGRVEVNTTGKNYFDNLSHVFEVNYSLNNSRFELFVDSQMVAHLDYDKDEFINNQCGANAVAFQLGRQHGLNNGQADQDVYWSYYNGRGFDVAELDPDTKFYMNYNNVEEAGASYWNFDGANYVESEVWNKQLIQERRLCLNGKASVADDGVNQLFHDYRNCLEFTKISTGVYQFKFIDFTMPDVNYYVQVTAHGNVYYEVIKNVNDVTVTMKDSAGNVIDTYFSIEID